jgi:acyl-CoA thioesterase FadM
VIKGKVTNITERKATIEAELYAGGKLCVTGEIIAVLVPDNFGE